MGTPRVRMPTNASASIPRLRSTISCAMRASDRETRSASITTGMGVPESGNRVIGQFGNWIAELVELVELRELGDWIARCVEGIVTAEGPDETSRTSRHLLAFSQERLKERQRPIIQSNDPITRLPNDQIHRS